MQFDARAARQLRPGEHMIVEGCPGLRLVAAATRATWTYRYKSPVDGRMRQIALGHWPAMGLPAAAGAWSAARARRDAGEELAQQRRDARRDAAMSARQRGAGTYTVGALAADYLAGHIRQRRVAKGAAEVARLFDRHLADIADLPAAALTRAQAFNLLEARADTPVQTNMLRQELAAAWDYAADAGRLPDTAVNWWRLVMRGRLRSKGPMRHGVHSGTAKRVLNAAELGQLVRWLPNFTRLVGDALTLYLWTGARGAEIVAMEAREIAQEPDGWWWTVPKAKTKNARRDNAADLRVPLVGRALEVVRRRLDLIGGDGYIFPSRPDRSAGHVEQKVVGVAVWVAMPYCQTRPQYHRPRLPVTHWAPHDLRRSVRTLLASMGCPSDVAESVLGHMLAGVEGVYNLHRYDAERRHWLTLLSAKLEEFAEAA